MQGGKRDGERVARDDFIEYFYFIYTNQATPATIYKTQDTGGSDFHQWGGLMYRNLNLKEQH